MTAAETEPKVVEAEEGVWVVGGGDNPTGEAGKENEAKPAVKGGYSAEPAPEFAAPAAEEKRPAADGEAVTENGTTPSLVNLMFQGKAGEPQAEFFIVHFQQHLEPVLKEMALNLGEKWLAAGGHTGTDVNPNKVLADPIMQQTSADSVFKDVFKSGFAMECLEAMTGPPSPMILFKFRHVGQFTGKYVDHDGKIWEGKEQMIETDGMCQALKLPGMDTIQKVDIFYNHQKPIRIIADPEAAENGTCPMSGKEGVCPLMK
eukprot:TRINITY_DN93421_c0_g1_i1.p1 TRINITY_DN93421_c0_g1~~TRINITY_DN93421_c0_g1_i1.p1  ORF type:complete len:260 (-),score=87.07 TRINITY_DN93421_c0_g1_i1:369-1148(-)